MKDRDDLLLKQAREGDRRAFGRLVNRYRDRILYLAYDFLHDYETAQDVAQEIFIKAYRNLNNFEERSKFSSWLYRIAVNTCLDVKRQKARQSERRKPDYPDELISVSDSFAGPGDKIDDTLITAIDQLSENQQTAIVLRFFQNQTIMDIAQLMNCSESTVRVHLHRGLLKLENILNKSGMDQSGSKSSDN
jgi:RNA polymerase sigma-70 factor (ECF subfamily)